MGSSRLPGKVMKKALGRPLLDWLIDRLKSVQCEGRMIIATTYNPSDDCIADLAGAQGVDCVRGSEDDPLARYVQVNRRFGLDIVVRLTADNPLLDPSIVNEMVRYFLASHPPLDYLSNARRCGYPFGYIAEVIRAECLEAAFAASDSKHDHEHVTPWIWERGGMFRIGKFVRSGSHVPFRLTVDTPEDLDLVTWIIKRLSPTNPLFKLEDVIALLEAHPEKARMNRHVEQRGYKDG